MDAMTFFNLFLHKKEALWDFSDKLLLQRWILSQSMLVSRYIYLLLSILTTGTN